MYRIKQCEERIKESRLIAEGKKKLVLEKSDEECVDLIEALLGKKEILGISICTMIYTAVSYFGNWFDKNIYVTAGFAGYVIFLYVCVYFVYKCRRKIDDKILNYDLELFKTRSEKEE